MYYVFLEKYLHESKSIKHKFLSFLKKDDLLKYLHDYLIRHSKYSRYSKYNTTRLTNLNLHDIVREAIKIGFILQDEKRCYAITKIIQGLDLFHPKPDNSSEHSSSSSCSSDEELVEDEELLEESDEELLEESDEELLEESDEESDEELLEESDEELLEESDEELEEREEELEEELERELEEREEEREEELEREKLYVTMFQRKKSINLNGYDFYINLQEVA